VNDDKAKWLYVFFVLRINQTKEAWMGRSVWMWNT